MAETIDYKSVLADLKARRAALDQAIGAIEAIIGEGITTMPAGMLSGNGTQTPLGPPSPTMIEPDTFYGLNILAATKKYLGIVNRKAQSTEQVAEALRAGGVQAKTESVAAILQRAINASDPDLRRPRRGMWGLAEWYAR